MSQRVLWLLCVFLTYSGIGIQAQVTPIVAPPGQNVQNQVSGATVVTSGTGIDYHGGPVMVSSHNVYFVWYGNWSGNTAVTILPGFISGLNGSSYFNTDTTYFNGSGQSIPNSVSMGSQVFDSYSQGSVLSDQGLTAAISRQLQAGTLPTDANGIYFVLTSADVDQQGSLGEFCVQFCGFHNHATLNGTDIKYSFVGNIDRCPSVCAAGNLGVGPNGNFGADAMANVMAHELNETVTDPDLNAWFDANGQEDGDKCNFNFGPEFSAPNGAPADVTLGGRPFLIQQNWVNATGSAGGCQMGFTQSTFTNFGPNEQWINIPYFGSQGTFFADVTGDGKADAIAVNSNSPVVVRRSTGTSFSPNEFWTDIPYFGDKGTFFADVTGDGKADAIVVNSNSGVVVRRSTGNSFSTNESWIDIPFFGDIGTFFADVTGDGKADAIVVNSNSAVVVRRSTGSSFGPNESWTDIPFVGDKGNFFADVTGDGKADAIAVTSNGIFVRRSTGSSFSPNEQWSGPYFGDLGTFFADVDGDGKADAIVVNLNGVFVRRSTGSSFGPLEAWTSSAYFGNIGTFFADVTGDRAADAIVIDNNSTAVVVRRAQ